MKWERPKDIVAQRMVACRYAETKPGCYPAFHNIPYGSFDAFLFDEGDMLQAILEVKCRSGHFDDWETMILDVHKIKACASYAELLGCICIVLVEYENGDIYLHKLNDFAFYEQMCEQRVIVRKDRNERYLVFDTDKKWWKHLQSEVE